MTAASQLGIGSARRITLPTGGGPIAALRAGPDGGAPVLLVPGYTGSKEDFGPILDPIADAGFQVSAIDLPGQYESPGPSDPAAYGTDALGAWVVDIAGCLGAPVHLVGHSFGGLVARAAVIRDRSRFVDLVLMGSGPAAIAGERRSRLDELAPVFAVAGAGAVYAAMQTADSVAPGWTPPPAALARFLEDRFAAGSPAMLLGMADALRAEPDRVGALAASGIACLVIHRAQDTSWPPRVQEQMARRLGAKHIVIADAAHSPAIECAEQTARALLEFWHRAPPSRG